MKKIKKQKKALLGAILAGAGISLLGSTIGGIMSRNSSKRQIREQQKAQNRQDTYAMAQNLSNAYGNQEYIDEFNNRVTFKNGGKTKTKDRISTIKKFACGGRKKAKWGGDDTNALVSGISSGLGNVISASLASSVNPNIKKGTMFSNTPKEHLERPDYLIENNITPQYIMRAGGRKCRKCGGRK